MLSTIGTSKAAAGFPVGSIVEVAADAAGLPIFALSSLSGHTKDLRSDPRCSLTVTSPGFKVHGQPNIYQPFAPTCMRKHSQQHCRVLIAGHGRCAVHTSRSHEPSGGL